jgi:hypothetical protein
MRLRTNGRTGCSEIIAGAPKGGKRRNGSAPRLAVDRGVHEFGLDARVHLSPHAEIRVEFQSQVRVFDRRTLRRSRLNGRFTHDVGAAATTPEKGNKIANGRRITDQNSHLPHVRGRKPQKPRTWMLAPKTVRVQSLSWVSPPARNEPLPPLMHPPADGMKPTAKGR